MGQALARGETGASSPTKRGDQVSFRGLQTQEQVKLITHACPRPELVLRPSSGLCVFMHQPEQSHTHRGMGAELVPRFPAERLGRGLPK